MAIILLIRVALLACIFVAGLFAIIATAGKEWQKHETKEFHMTETYTVGLWDFCVKRTRYRNQQESLCSPIKNILRSSFKSSPKEKLDVTRAFMIIDILLYGAAFTLLALAQFLKKDIFQKTVAPVFWGTFTCGVIAMSCYTSYGNNLRDKFEEFSRPLSYSWAYGLGWASVGITLLGSLVSSVAVFISPRDVGNPTISFKK